MSALRELIASFGISVDSKELEHGHKEVEGFKETLLKLGEALGVALGLHEFKQFVSETIEAGAHVKDLSERLGVGGQELQAFQFAAAQAGVNSEEAAHSLGLLNRTIGEAIVGGGEAAQAFAKLGIGLKGPGGTARDVNDILLDVAGAFEKLPDQQTRAAYAMKLFGREGQALLPVLGKGREALAGQLAEFRELGGGMSDEFLEQSKKVADEQKKLSLGWLGLKTDIVGALLPAVSKLVHFLQDVVKWARDVAKHTHVFQTALRALVGAGVIGGLFKIVSAVRAIAAAGAIASAPLWLMVGAAALLYLGFDELYTLLKGGKTLIGDALGPDKAQFVWDLREAIDTLSGAGKELFSDISDDGQAMSGFKTIVVDTAEALAYLVKVMAAVVEGGKKIGEAVGGLIFGGGKTQQESDQEILTPKARALLEAQRQSGSSSYAPVGFAKERSIVERIRARREANASLLPPEGPNASIIPAHELGGARFLGPPPSIPFPSVGAGGAPGAQSAPTVNQQNTFNLEVHTKDDPQQVSGAVRSSLATDTQRATEKAYRVMRKP